MENQSDICEKSQLAVAVAHASAHNNGVVRMTIVFGDEQQKRNSKEEQQPKPKQSKDKDQEKEQEKEQEQDPINGQAKEKEQSIAFKTCDKNHRLIFTNHSLGGYEIGFVCNKCSTVISGHDRWACLECEFDVCQMCQCQQVQAQTSVKVQQQPVSPNPPLAYPPKSAKINLVSDNKAPAVPIVQANAMSLSGANAGEFFFRKAGNDFEMCISGGFSAISVESVVRYGPYDDFLFRGRVCHGLEQVRRLAAEHACEIGDAPIKPFT